MRIKALSIASGAVLAAAALAPGVASADLALDPRPRTPAPPPASAVTSEVLARGSAGEFRVRDAGTGIRLSAAEPTDLALVRATLAVGGATGWHGHAGPSMVIVADGALTMVEPGHGRDHGCTRETFTEGEAFAHPSGAHDFVNEGDALVVFYVAYFLPEGAPPAPVPAPAPRGC